MGKMLYGVGDIDLLHPPAELEARKHKLKRKIPTPNSFFMDVKCPGCYNMCARVRFGRAHAARGRAPAAGGVAGWAVALPGATSERTHCESTVSTPAPHRSRCRPALAC